MKRLLFLCLFSLLALNVPANAGCDWARAVKNIAWVLDEDAAARTCFNRTTTCRFGKPGQTSAYACNGLRHFCIDARTSVLQCPVETETLLFARGIY